MDRQEPRRRQLIVLHGLFAAMLSARAGLRLSAYPAEIVERKLARVSARFQADGVEGLVTRAAAEPSGPEMAAAIAALLNHDTYFFRDAAPFRFMANEVFGPRLLGLAGGGAPLNVWSAACSTGQEAYSLAILWRDLGGAGQALRLLATDLSHDCVAAARKGYYTRAELDRGLLPAQQSQWFDFRGAGATAKPTLREQLQFEETNLLRLPTPTTAFDVIFCRNVLLYFEPALRARVLQDLCRRLAPGGAIVLGTAETTVGLECPLSPVDGYSGVYRLDR